MTALEISLALDTTFQALFSKKIRQYYIKAKIKFLGQHLPCSRSLSRPHASQTVEAKLRNLKLELTRFKKIVFSLSIRPMEL